MNTRLSSVALALVLLGAAACGDDTTAPTDGSGGSSGAAGGTGYGGGTTSAVTGTTSNGSGGEAAASTGASTGAGGEGGGGTVLPPDHDRFVVVGLPYGEDDYVTDYEVLSLTTAGTLARIGKRFQMGSAEAGVIEFTPDGRIGVVTQRQGTLGIFRIDEEGSVTVIDPGFTAEGFFASTVHMDPSGTHVIAVDEGWPNVGGGLYRVDLDGATGEPTLVGRLFETKNAWSVLPLASDRWAVAGVGAGGVEDETDLHDVRREPFARAGGTDAFPYDAAFPAGLAASADRSFLIVGDNSEFTPTPNNVRLVTIDDAGFTASGDSLEVLDPYAIAIAPEGDVALVASGYGDALFVVDVDATSDTPLTLREELAYTGAGAQLPGHFAAVHDGPLAGLVLNVDIQGLRVVRFIGGGEVVDLGITSVGEGNAGLIAAVGVQP